MAILSGSVKGTDKGSRGGLLVRQAQLILLLFDSSSTLSNWGRINNSAVKEQQEVVRDVKAMQWKKKEEKMLEMTMTRSTKQTWDEVCSCKAQTTSNNQQ